MVEVRAAGGRPAAFRVRQRAGLLIGRAVPHEERAGPCAPLVVGPDLTVLVRAGGPEVEVHRLLGLAGELAGPTPDGLRYRLTVERVQELFDDGTTGPDLVRYLEERCESPMPQAAAEQIMRWWDAHGTMCLYDDVEIGRASCRERV